MAVTTELKYIAYKHVANGAYPGSAFVLAGVVAHLPVAVLETLIYVSIAYFMAGLTPAAGNFFFFCAVVFLVDVFFRNMMSTFALLGRTLQVAQAMPLPFIALLIIFAGFLVVKSKMGWMLFINCEVQCALRSAAGGRRARRPPAASSRPPPSPLPFSRH